MRDESPSTPLERQVTPADAVPTSWLDPLLTGPDAIIKPDENGRFNGTDIENLLRAVKKRVASITHSERTSILEECARACEKLAERRFDEYGIREPDTGATYYGGSTAAEYDTRDEEDADCAAAIRALKAAK